jgi:AraC-like DNA-binding protein
LPIVVRGGTGNAWANPPPAETPRRLVLSGGFQVDGGRDRRLDERARVLGFEDLRAYLQARCNTGHSIPRIATELGVRDWQVQAALTRLQVRLAPRSQRLAVQRRRYTEQRLAARVARLGFADVGAYLVDRVVEHAWLLAEVAAELGAHRLTVRRLLDRCGIRRVRRTPAERAAADEGRRVQSVGWRARRAARLAELGFADLAGYLRARHLEQGWSVKRMRAELGVGRRWLVGELARLGAGAAAVGDAAPPPRSAPQPYHSRRHRPQQDPTASALRSVQTATTRRHWTPATRRSQRSQKQERAHKGGPNGTQTTGGIRR